jgi:hypothetical protein
MKSNILFLGLLLSLLTISCSKDSSDNSSITADEATINAKIDLANDDVSDVVETQFNATMENNTAGKSSEAATLVYPIITRVPEFGTPITVGTLVTKTIDYGTAGVTLLNGNILRGIIRISFTYEPTAVSHTINYTFDNFYHNAIKFDGNKTFTRTMTAGTNSHPIVVMNMDMTATFPDGRVVQRTGTRTREITAGYATPNVLIDNVYQVTGNWSTTFPNSAIQTSTITSPLIVKMSCMAVNKPLLVQGVISIVRNTNTGTLDYGDGNCDTIATFTINGVSYTIIIGN